jgi:glycerol uptake facilitator-like aquaporin
MKASLDRRATAEFFGTAFLVAAVVGSGIMGERLSNGTVGLALLCNTIATGAALVALILTFGPISGAHFNPAVTLCDALEHGISWADTPAYIGSQILGGITGAITANLMFDLPAISLSHHARSGARQIFSEFIATFGLLSVIWGVHDFVLHRFRSPWVHTSRPLIGSRHRRRLPIPPFRLRGV